MVIAVEACATDKPISLGSYNESDPNSIPPECRATSNGTFDVFDFAVTQCNTITIVRVTSV